MLLAKMNVKAWFDVSKTDYRNDGHLYKIHSNEFELVFYDKVKDLEQAKKSPKRALEKETGIQTSLLNKADFDRRKQVLRIEARLGTRRKIRDLLEKVGFPAMAETKNGLPLEKLFSQALAQKILLYYWKHFQKSLPGIITPLGKSPADLYRQISQARPDAKDAQLLKWVSAYTIVQEVGWPGLKSLWISSSRTFERLKKEIEELELASCVSVTGFLQVQQSLMMFEPLTMDALTV